VEIDTSRWSGEGVFTQLLIERLSKLDALTLLRVEDAPASRSEAEYNFISNEIFVLFTTTTLRETVRRFGLFPDSRTTASKRMNIAGLGAALESMEDIGAPDYADEGMLQYLRTERVVPPYQTKGYKLVELVRLYELGSSR
jgi:hypothetical protein